MRRIILSLIVFLSVNSGFASQYKSGMVVSESRLASEVGADILRHGGNAIDAAVGVGYALAVVKPCCGNIGGGGFMVIHFANGKNIFLNFRETAPAAANASMYDQKNKNSTLGFLAVGVPGTVLGLDTALQRYGTMSRHDVMAKAIELADKGFTVTPYDAEQFKEEAAIFRNNADAAKIFLKHGEPYKTGDLLIQKNLAHTLRLIAEKGSDVFYKGSIAHEIVRASNEHGGILTLDDFAHYTVKESAPISCNYHGYQILSAPPPSSGGVTLCESLNILENFPISRWQPGALNTAQTIIETMRYSFIDRNSKLGDPDFVNNPIQKLLSRNYAAEISNKIRETKRAPQNLAPAFHPEMTDTTHYSVMDKDGNAVSVTYTLNGFFGSGVVGGNTGVLLNNEMDDFAINHTSANKFNLVQSSANSIEPKKRPLSSMTPTIVLKDGKVFMVLGSPGGPRIITSVLLTLINVIDYDLPLQNAIDKPRFHYQANPDVVDVEPFSSPFILRKQLELLGYHILPQHTWGAVEAILIKQSTNEMIGGSDSRRPDGAAIRVPE